MMDLLIIGGGINGTAIAADAASRGLSVVLCEKNDLASATSSASSKLIHGGLRYLEQYDFRLVHEALTEREILLRKAPHLVKPLQFVIPHNKRLRPAWLIRLGLFFYDHLGKHVRLAKSHAIDLTKEKYGQPLIASLKKGFIYTDCQTDDSRLTVTNALAAKEHQAQILTYTKFISAKRFEDHWETTLQDQFSQKILTFQTHVLINAAGPWTSEILKNHLQMNSQHQVELVKGSHILVKKLYDHDAAYLLQNDDGRVIFIIPFHDHSLIGTTDMPFSGDLAKVTILEEEKKYLCKAVNDYLKHPVTPQDIVWSYAGVRALQHDNATNLAKVTRDYALELNTDENKAPLLSIFGGKLTTHRILAEHTLETLSSFFSLPPCQTAQTPLPGGDIAQADFSQFFNELKHKYSWLPENLLLRYAQQYGTKIHLLLKDCVSISDLGNEFAKQLYEREIQYLIQHEWAKTVDDILWRRTKLGLIFSPTEIENLSQSLSNMKV